MTTMTNHETDVAVDVACDEASDPNDGEEYNPDVEIELADDDDVVCVSSSTSRVLDSFPAVVPPFPRALFDRWVHNTLMWKSENVISRNGMEVLRKRYLRKLDDGSTETVPEMFWRVAANVAASHSNDVERRANAYYDALSCLLFFPNSPTFTGWPRFFSFFFCFVFCFVFFFFVFSH